MEDIEANLSALSIDDIKRRLEPLMKGLRIESPVFEPATFVYRGRRVTSSFSKESGIFRRDLIYPPARAARLGRLNRRGQSVFYCGLNKAPLFFEVQGLLVGDELILSFWKTTARMLVNNIGYTDHVFRQLGAKRSSPPWKPISGTPGEPRATIALAQPLPESIASLLSKDSGREVREALSRYFMTALAPAESDKYKLTAAIGELHLGEIENEKSRFAGVLYPSTRMWANGDNLALLPWFVDEHLEFRKAVHIRVDARTETTFEISSLDAAKGFDREGKLVWLGRLPKWTLQPMQVASFTGTFGVDDDGDYETGEDGSPCHWVGIDSNTGRRIEPD